MTAPARRDAGITLVELMVSLAVFALLAVAGFALVDGVLRARERTDGRLERLAEIQRALHMVTADFEQAGAGPIVVTPELVSFRRSGSTTDAAEILVGYSLTAAALVRTVGAGPAARRQTLLTGVGGLSLSLYAPETGWTATPPLTASGLPRRPDAVAAELTLLPADGALAGPLRRVVLLPATP